MKIFVFGYFGCGNLGDEAILGSFVEWCKDKIPGAGITAQSSNPEQTAKTYGIGAVHKYRIPALVGAIRHSSAVVAPGGGLLQDTTSIKSLIYYLLLISLAHFFRKPVFLLSQGIGPLNSGIARTLVWRALRRCRHVAVRDEASAALLRSLKVPENIIECSGDIVLLGDIKEERFGAKKSPGGGGVLKVGLSLRPSWELEHLNGVLLGCLLRLNEHKPLELQLFALSREDDLPLLDNFAAKIKECCPTMPVRMIGGRDDTTLTVEDMEREVAALDVMVGMRLHALIFSARNAVPFVGLSYDPKVAAFGQACRQQVVESLSDADSLQVIRKIEQALDCEAECRMAMKQSLLDSRRALLEDMSLFHAELSLAVEGPRPVMSVPISQLSFERTMNYIFHTVERGGRLHVVTVNPEMLMLAMRNAEFKRILRQSALNTVDGVGVRLAFKMKYGKRIETVPGVEMMEQMLRVSAERGLRIFLLGARPEIIGEAVKRAAAMNPAPIIAGSHHGYLKDIDPKELVEKINKAAPNIVLVGMGTPAQELWISRNMDHVHANVFIGVGGSLDVLAGASRRAPRAWRKLGLEWLYRTVTQPSRLGRVASLPLFLLLIILEAFVYRLHIRRDG
jgi:polysaccharide pyruvyl transferase CsaB